LPTWAKWVIGIVGALILLGIGGAIGSSEEDNLKSEVTQANAERDNAKQEAAAVAARQEQIIEQTRASAAQIIGKAKSERSQLSGELQGDRDELKAIRGELAETESSLSGAEHEKQLSTFGDGIWKSETDFIPGTYRAPGGGGCYWATLNSADPYDIASNENGTGPQIATINTPYFQSKGCGTWERIGE
jgi:hypothetical protein